MSNYGYLAHHGVKGQKWGVRKQQPTSNRIRSSSPSTRPSPDRRKAIAIAAISAIGAASLIGGGVAAAKNPQAVTKALGSIGKAFAKKAVKGDIWKGTAKKSAKIMKRNFRRQTLKSIPKKGIKAAGESAKGVINGLTGAAKEMATEKYVHDVVQKGITKGVETIGIAAITGGLGIAVKTAMSGDKPTRREIVSYMTKNPNKKGK